MTASKPDAFRVPERWTFETPEVARAFDEHVREQLPWYDLVTSAIAHLARHYITPESRVYDLGASTGNITRALEVTVKERNAQITAVEPSAEMCRLFSGDAELLQQRAEETDFQPFSVAILNLTLQFIHPARRAELLTRLLAQAQPGGAVILVDKFEPGPGYLATALYRLTLAGKIAQGADPAAILTKELSLGGVQRPLKHADFAEWTPFFRYGDFTGYIREAESA